MFQQQPMKMASAESLCDTETDPDFSILTVGTHNNCDSVTRVIEVPYVLPFLAESRFSGVTLQGVRNLQQQYEQRFGPNDYRPNLFVTYWSFRMMIGLLAIPVLFALAALVADPRRPDPEPAVVLLVRAADHSHAVPGQQRRLGVHRDGPAALGRGAEPDRRSTGSAHRQPKASRITRPAWSSPRWSTFTLLYAVLAVIWFWLLKRYIVEGPLEHDAEPAAPKPPGDDEVAPLSFAY